MFMCDRGIYFTSVSMIFQLDLGTVLTGGISVFHLIITMIVSNVFH